MEINTHYGVLEYARSKLGQVGYEVTPIRQSDDGSGTLAIARTKGRDMRTALPYRLPLDCDTMDEQIRVLGTTEDTGEAWDRSRRE